MKTSAAVLALVMLFTSALSASAHFGMVIPSQAVVSDAGEASLDLALQFWHPFANSGMSLAKPASFTVYHGGKAIDLSGSLVAQKVRDSDTQKSGFDTWKGLYKINRPGLYSFVMVPNPYWEPAEDCYIVHYTKVQVAGFGDDEGWDKPLGLKIEIVPLAKPYALYTGNIFQGQVLMDGKPVPNAEVEIEHYPGPQYKGIAPNDLMVTQTIKADGNGIFSYAAPRAGWWGFAALQEGPEKMEYKGVPKPVEIGGVIWVQFVDMPKPVELK